MPQIKRWQFRAKIYQVGVNRCVDVPERVTRVLGPAKYIPVKGQVENIVFHSTLVPRGRGRHRLFIHSRIWRKLGLDTGGTVRITLSQDKQSREVVVPDEITAALGKRGEARAAFDALTATGRRAFVAWILQAKKPETRSRRIEIGMERLIERGRRKKQKKGIP